MMMLRLCLLPAAFLWAASLFGCGSPIGYKVHWEGDFLSGGLDKSPHIIVIKNLVDLDRIRGRLADRGFPDFNEADLANRVLIAVVSGAKSTPGYEVRITKIENASVTGGVEISISEFTTGKDMVLAMVTWPITIVSISSAHEAALSKGVKCIDSEGNLWADKVYPDWWDVP